MAGAAVAAPSGIISPECRDATLTPRWWAADRRNVCLLTRYGVDTNWVYSDGHVELKGQFVLTQTYTMFDRLDGPRIDLFANFTVSYQWGLGYPNAVTMSAFSKDLSSRSYFPVSHPSFDVWKGTGQLVYDTKVATANTMYTDPRPYFAFSVDSADWDTGPVYAEQDYPASRCDSVVVGTKGCVFREVPGFALLSRTSYPEVIAHL